MLAQEPPTNTIIETPLGIGTYALLAQALEAQDSNVFVLAANHEVALFLSILDGKFVVAKEIMVADTLIIDEAVTMELPLSRVIEEIVQQRTLHGRPLPALKRVILLYPDWGQSGRKFFIDLGTRFTPVHITRSAPSDAVIATMLEALSGRGADGKQRPEYRSAITLKAGDVMTLPGVGTKLVGAINQLDFDRYQIRLDEKFVESIVVDVRVQNGEQRTPERHVSRQAHEDRREGVDQAVADLVGMLGNTIHVGDKVAIDEAATEYPKAE
jgi:hypothetical protein